MKSSLRFTTVLVLSLVALAVVPASASQAPRPKILSCTTTSTSLTVRWVTPKTPADKKIYGYAVLTRLDQTATIMYGLDAREGTVRRLTPRTAYRVQLVPFVENGSNTIPTCLAYTKTKSGQFTVPMRPPSILSTTTTTTTATVRWRMNASATSALPSSYQITAFPEDKGTGPTISLPEPLSANSATVTGLMPGTSYYIDVGTVNAWGQWSVGSLVETELPIATTTTTVPPTSTTTVPAG